MLLQSRETPKSHFPIKASRLFHLNMKVFSNFNRRMSIAILTIAILPLMTIAILCIAYSTKNLIKELTCYKNLCNPTCMDFTITIHPKYFKTLKFAIGTYQISIG